MTAARRQRACRPKVRIIRVRYRDRSFYAAIASPESVRCLNNEEDLPDEIPLAEVELLPLVRPSKIVCVGLNYQDHASELGLPVPEEPVLFLKPPSSVIGPGDPIIMPASCERLDYEAELALVMGRTARFVSEADAPRHIFGYTCANDVTARDLQKKDGQWTRAKGFDTFCPFGPAVATGLDPSTLTVKTTLNGQVRQDFPISDMRFSVQQLVSMISQDMTLYPGDIILCGTSVGVGSMKPGSTVEVEISGIGTLTNRFE